MVMLNKIVIGMLVLASIVWSACFGRWWERQQAPEFRVPAYAARQLWIDALESGKYEKSKYRMVEQGADGRRYSAFGVACELFKQYEYRLTLEWEPNGHGEAVGHYGNWESLPPRVQRWLGFKSTRGEFTLCDRDDFEQLGYDYVAMKKLYGKRPYVTTDFLEQSDRSFEQMAKVIRLEEYQLTERE